jgi:hypothetical protein
MSMKVRLAALAIVLTAPILPAWATTPPPAMYMVTEEAPGRVRICLLSYQESRTCPDHGLLRQSVDGGEVVEITACDTAACFLDECVAAGSYRYGLVDPFHCTDSGAPALLASITIAGADASCVRTTPDPLPAADVPWSSSSGNWVNCSSGGTGHSGCASAPAASSTGAGLAMLLAGALLWRWRARRRSRA